MSIKIFSKRRLGFGIFMALFSLLFLAACSTQPASQTRTPTSPELIKPGDTVNGVLVTTGTADSKFLFDIPCTKKDGVDLCTTTFGNPINPTAAVYDQDPEKLQTKWDAFVYTVTIDGRQVNLAAFGSIDFTHKRTGLNMRAYNLVLIGSEPVTVTVHDAGSLPGESFGSDVMVAFGPAVVDDPIQPLMTATGRLGQHPYTSVKTSFDLLLYLPGEYGKDPQQTWPLILFLHGGPNVTSLDWVRIKPLAVQLDNQFEFPFIVASPLHTGENQHWSQPAVMNELLALTTELQTLFAINPNQIYLAGFIEGANGVWELGIAHPELFAAIVPVGGYIDYPFNVPKNICDLKDMPVWAFHGADDPNIPVNAQQMLVDALKTCGNDTVQFTIYPNASYEIFHTAFADPNLYAWLREQSR
jgi:hypothetical protein